MEGPPIGVWLTLLVLIVGCTAAPSQLLPDTEEDGHVHVPPPPGTEQKMPLDGAVDTIASEFNDLVSLFVTDNSASDVQPILLSKQHQMLHKPHTGPMYTIDGNVYDDDDPLREAISPHSHTHPDQLEGGAWMTRFYGVDDLNVNMEKNDNVFYTPPDIDPDKIEPPSDDSGSIMGAF